MTSLVLRVVAREPGLVATAEALVLEPTGLGLRPLKACGARRSVSSRRGGGYRGPATFDLVVFSTRLRVSIYRQNSGMENPGPQPDPWLAAARPLAVLISLPTGPGPAGMPNIVLHNLVDLGGAPAAGLRY